MERETVSAQDLARAKPVVKWAGGKSQLLAQLYRQVPANGRHRYHEPFVGGGALFFYLCRKGRIEQAFLNDANRELIETYRVIRDEPEALIEHLQRHAAEHRRGGDAYYYEVRAWDRDPEQWARLSSIERAARFLYLNRTCYNGLYRVNGDGQFNVPAGRYEGPRIVFPKRIFAVAAALQLARLSHDDFEVACSRAEPGDLVYLDPPYAPVSETADFSDYTPEGFDAADQHRLADVFGQLARRGCWVLLSNSDTPLVRELYADRGRIYPVRARRSINTNGDGRGPVAEVAVLHKTTTP